MDEVCSRRNVLRLSVSLGIVGLAGCVPSDSDAQGDERQDNSSTPSGDGKESAALWSGDDPGVTSYPKDPTGPEDKMIGSMEIRDMFYQQFMKYRVNNDREGLYHDKTGLVSIARTHSRAMHENGYIGVENPDGSEFSPTQYKDLQTSCKSVDRVVHAVHKTVGLARGGRTDVDSQAVARQLFSEVQADSEKRKKLLQPKSKDDTAVGVGVFITSHTDEDGATVADVYLTIDFCHGFKHDQFN